MKTTLKPLRSRSLTSIHPNFAYVLESQDEIRACTESVSTFVACESLIMYLPPCSRGVETPGPDTATKMLSACLLCATMRMSRLCEQCITHLLYINGAHIASTTDWTNITVGLHVSARWLHRYAYIAARSQYGSVLASYTNGCESTLRLMFANV